MSSSERTTLNLQNFSIGTPEERRVREAFRRSQVILPDLSRLELRVLLAEDEKLWPKSPSAVSHSSSR